MIDVYVVICFVAGHWHRGNHDQELGIITGFAIGLSCIIICMVIIFVRSRYVAYTTPCVLY